MTQHVVTPDDSGRTTDEVRSAMIPIGLIDRDKNQPRKHFEPRSQEELTESMHKHGQLTAILVAPAPVMGRYQLIAGERRLRGAEFLRWEDIRADVLPKMPLQSELKILQLIENCQRRDLTAVEQLEAFEQLQIETGASGSALAKMLCVSPAKVTRIFSLRKLPSAQLQLVREGKISSTNSYAMTRMSEADRDAFARQAAEGRLNREAVEAKAARKKSVRTTTATIVNLATPKGHLRFSSEESLTVAQLLEILDGVVKEVRKAKAQGFNLKTLESVLNDRVEQLNETEGGA